jgi:hypothetical protein
MHWEMCLELGQKKPMPRPLGGCPLRSGYLKMFITGWWFGTWIICFHILGMSSCQLTIFQRARGVGIPPTRYGHSTGTWLNYDSPLGLGVPFKIVWNNGIMIINGNIN